MEADEAFKKATALNVSHPSNTYGYRMMAHMRQGCGEHTVAIKLLDQALAEGRGEQAVEAHFLRGACHHAIGQHALAVKDYEAALMGNSGSSREEVCLSLPPSSASPSSGDIPSLPPCPLQPILPLLPLPSLTPRHPTSRSSLPSIFASLPPRLL